MPNSLIVLAMLSSLPVFRYLILIYKLLLRMKIIFGTKEPKTSKNMITHGTRAKILVSCVGEDKIWSNPVESNRGTPEAPL